MIPFDPTQVNFLIVLVSLNVLQTADCRIVLFTGMVFFILRDDTSSGLAQAGFVNNTQRIPLVCVQR